MPPSLSFQPLETSRLREQKADPSRVLCRALIELGRLYEAQEALLLGLSFEPDNVELNAFRAEIEAKIAAAEDAEWAQLRGEKPADPAIAPSPDDGEAVAVN